MKKILPLEIPSRVGLGAMDGLLGRHNSYRGTLSKTSYAGTCMKLKDGPL